MTDTPATFPACRHAQWQSEPCACYAAGVAAERQRIHDKLTAIVTRWAADATSGPIASDSLLGRLLYAIRTLGDADLLDGNHD